MLITGYLSLLALCALVLHKVRKVHLMQFALRDAMTQGDAALYRQCEALWSLQRELDLPGSLPPLRGWAASPDFLLELVRHVRQQRPRSVVECSSGASTLVLARCLQQQGGGKVRSLEHDPQYAAQTRAGLARLGLSDYAEVLDAPLMPFQSGDRSWQWYRYEVLPAGLPIDLLVIDGPPQATGALARYPAGPALFAQLTPGAAVFLDDAARRDETAILARWRDEFPQLRQRSLQCEKGCAVLQR
ncbi:class I SAM-dependent methyltransferase [Duganella callida]|uniref:Class I SAM-dependent methyltransferase n=1 Tax=Duganella callida TaxID=2561932 RepID=A0A4Y9SEI4_9BURK|nr:class I SAM-dependent methyltransferase [Duganella callida]TFW19387.1 class I SAM-dependent methyltransferase [Duganella callida]